MRDLDRLLSFYLAAKNTGRYLVIDLKQAYLLELFDNSATQHGLYPGPMDKHIQIFIPRGEWGLIDKDLKKFTRKLLDQDYPTWARKYLDYPNTVDYRDVAKNQNKFIFSCNDFKLQDLSLIHI